MSRALQAVSVVQATQAFDRQIGFAGSPQSALRSHSTQAPLATQCPAGAVQSVAEPQGSQAPVAVLQTGVVPPQSAFRTHPLHMCVPMSQTWVSGGQWSFRVQRTHLPWSQAGLAGSRMAQAGSSPQGTQTLFVQIGFAGSGHWLEVSQSTQAPLAAQTARGGCSAWHCETAVHLAQIPPAPQMGAVPEQSALVRQLEHWPEASSHWGGEPAHWLSAVH